MRFCSLFASGLIIFIVFGALLALIYHGLAYSGEVDLKIIYHQFIFSLTQGAISSLLSVAVGYLSARSLFYIKIPSLVRSALLGFCGMCFVLPSITVGLGIIEVYGPIFELLDSKIYGWSGILIGHVFFNAPFSTLIFYSLLCSISARDFELARTLKLEGIRYVYFMEIARFKEHGVRLFFTVFAICFSSFTLVLLLGGSPRFSTFEVGIYQSLHFSLNLKLASLLSLAQIAFYVLLYFIIPKGEDVRLKAPRHVHDASLFKVLFLLCFFAFLLLPILTIIYDGLRGLLESSLQVSLNSALITSLSSATFSSLLCVTLALFAGLLSRRAPSFLSALIFGVPAIALGFGLFLIFKNFSLGYFSLLLIVSVLNSMMSLPFVFRILNFERIYHYGQLCLTLNLHGFRRFFIIDLPLLRASIFRALALAFCIGLGDFSAIALFGDAGFKTLTSLIFSAMGSYRSSDAAILALILLCLVMGVFTLSNLLSKDIYARA